jgi:hypothetical protein
MTISVASSFETALSRLLRMRSQTLMVRSAATPRVHGDASHRPENHEATDAAWNIN